MGIKVEGMEKLLHNISSYSEKMVEAIVIGAQLTQTQMVNHAKAHHASSAHGQKRFVTRTGVLVSSIQPGPIEISDRFVTAEVIARAPYAGYVEGDPAYKDTDIGVYPFLEPARKAHKKSLLENIKRMMKRVKP